MLFPFSDVELGVRLADERDAESEYGLGSGSPAVVRRASLRTLR
jgi:hypothetical protein